MSVSTDYKDARRAAVHPSWRVCIRMVGWMLLESMYKVTCYKAGVA